MISAIIGHFVAGVLALVLATIGASARGESSRGFQGDQSATPFILVALDGGGVIFGLIVWQLLRLARSCRLRADGTLPLHARFVFLGAMPEAWLGLAFYLLVRLLFADLPKALRK